MKIKSSLKPRCPKCKLVIRRSGSTGKPVRMITCEIRRHNTKQGRTKRIVRKKTTKGRK